MAFEKGKSGNPGGRKSDKPFADALRMELAAAGDDHKALRAIAKNLIALAQEPSKDAMPAINAIADRLDGKPNQTVDANIGHFDLDRMSDAEIIDRLAGLDARRRGGISASSGPETAGANSKKLN